MNGLPHWEQQELFLVLVSIMGLVVVFYGSILTTKDLGERTISSSATQSAGQPLRVHRHEFVRAKPDLCMRERNMI